MQRFDQIHGYHHIKRAIIVAITGMHSVGLMCIDNAPAAAQFASLARLNDIRCTVVRPCPCGNLGSVKSDCTCSGASIATHRMDESMCRVLNSDIFMKIGADASTGYGEHDLIVYKRIELGRTAPAPSRVLSPVCERLMGAAIRQLNIAPGGNQQIIGVAATIARLAGSNTIHPAHLAEALQYRAGRNE